MKTRFFTVLDSDDAYMISALEKMYDVVNELDSSQFISATFNSCFPDGKPVGTKFPENFDGSILEMRYKFKVRGDKHSIFISEPYNKYLVGFDYSFYKNKYAPQKIFFNIYDSDGMKSRFVNEPVKIYYQDLDDISSMSKDRAKKSSYFGLREGHLSFLNSYGSQLYNYPSALIRNLTGYQFYSIANKKGFSEIIKDLKHFKLQATLLYPIVFVYTRFKRLS